MLFRSRVGGPRCGRPRHRARCGPTPSAGPGSPRVHATSSRFPRARGWSVPAARTARQRQGVDSGCSRDEPQGGLGASPQPRSTVGSPPVRNRGCYEPAHPTSAKPRQTITSSVKSRPALTAGLRPTRGWSTVGHPMNRRALFLSVLFLATTGLSNLTAAAAPFTAWPTVTQANKP